ncbi:hypothetical protein DKX38_029062 [Salix brachista]|uniref:Uncharacterized protein n=1 Tax=Salix brachista TaxID=2182728 RepID=A0A5N5J2N6_9ROSI|nr:hypothetical protein DKX38_029062 [Salix brachista]
MGAISWFLNFLIITALIFSHVSVVASFGAIPSNTIDHKFKRLPVKRKLGKLPSPPPPPYPAPPRAGIRFDVLALRGEKIDNFLLLLFFSSTPSPLVCFITVLRLSMADVQVPATSPRLFFYSYNKLPEEPLRLSVLKLDAPSFEIEVMKLATAEERRQTVEATFDSFH